MNKGQENLKDVRSKGVVYTREERQEHRAAAEQLLAQTPGTPYAVGRALRRQFAIGPRHAARVVEEVMAEWVELASAKQKERNRAQAIARVKRDLHRARYELRTDKKTGAKTFVERDEPKLNAIARLEFLLMRLEGTDQPVQVDMNVRLSNALEGVLANLNAAQVERMVAHRREVERLADLARRRLPECVDVEGRPVE
jgi:hypothetical protein